MNTIIIQHPKGKRGVTIDKGKYQAIREAILEALKSRELTFTELIAIVEEKLQSKFEGSISWYVEWVKLDLEAKNVIERISRAQREYYKIM